MSAAELANNVPNSFRVLHDAIYAFPPTAHAWLVVFEFQTERLSPILRHYPPQRSWHYELRILPSTRRRGISRFPTLPAQVLTRIVEIATLPAQRDVSRYARSVFSLATVSKQWFPALDLIWSNPSWETPRPQLPVRACLSLASLIASSPHIAEKVVVCPRVRLQVIDDSSDEDVGNDDPTRHGWHKGAATRIQNSETLEAVVEATEGILKYARGLKEVHDLRTRKKLRDLKHVKSFYVVGSSREGGGNRIPPLDMEEVLDAIRGWGGLEVLEVVRPHEVQGSHASPILFGCGPERTVFHLKGLCVVNDYLHGRILTDLAPTTPTLQRVNLTDLIGLSNTDLRNFLLSTASSLEMVKIERCVPTTEDEENNDGLAFDVTVRHMSALKYARIQGDVVSNLALITPPPLQHITVPETASKSTLPHPLPTRTLTVMNCNILSVLKGTDPCGIGIIEAIQIARERSWGSIALRFGVVFHQDVQLELERAKVVVAQSGDWKSRMGFEYSVMGGYCGHRPAS